MNNFTTKYRNDQKFKTKTKLILYTIFVVLVSVYAISINDTAGQPDDLNLPNETNQPTKKNNDIIDLSDNYHYLATIQTDDSEFIYTIIKDNNKYTIIKEYDDRVMNYIYQDNNYYESINDDYILTNESIVYDLISKNYLDIETINLYLSKAIKENNQYTIYLKDIILGNDNDDYFVILINNNKVSIDYTPLMKKYNPDVTKYKVDITIIEGLDKEEKE